MKQVSGLKKAYTGNNQLFHPVTLNETKDEEKNTLFFQVLDGDCGSIIYFYWLIVAVGLMCITVVFACKASNRSKDIVVIISILLIGSMYLLILPQYTVPDGGIAFCDNVCTERVKC